MTWNPSVTGKQTAGNEALRHKASFSKLRRIMDGNLKLL